MANRRGSAELLLFTLVAWALMSTAEAAPKFKVVHGFDPIGSDPTKHDGVGLYDRLTLDAKGHLYGTTRGGGEYNYGTAFELTPHPGGRWSETILHSFNCKVESCLPEAGLTFDIAGNLYGEAKNDVFELKPGSKGWSLIVLHNGGGGAANVLLDHPGNLYAPLGHGKYGQGAISELLRDQGWKDKWLYSFCSRQDQKGLCLDGWGPFAGVTWGSGGVLYGTTLYGGDSPYCGNTGCGVVYELKPQKNGSWKETVLHSFPATKTDGAKLYDGVVLDKSGNVYGATYQGGSIDCGVIFKLSRKAEGTAWDETILYDFTNLTDGCSANTLTFDKQGNLWETAQGGTGKQCAGGCGVVFKMTPGAKGKWKYSVVHNFTGSDGAVPATAVIFDEHGSLYGTTELGGPGHSVGVVFEIIP